MNSLLGKAIICFVVFIIALFLITFYLDVLDKKDGKKEEWEKAWWTSRTIRRGK